MSEDRSKKDPAKDTQQNQHPHPQGQQKSPLKGITTSPFARSLSVVKMSLNAGTKYAAMQVGNLFRKDEAKQENMQEFLTSNAKILAKELGRLKGSLMKSGQMLSLYGEHFLPKEVVDILKTLQSDTQPIRWEQLLKVIKRELSEEDLAMLDIEEEAHAAASLGQVHKARCKRTGDLLAVKVQYPGVDKAIDSDLSTLKSILSVSRLIQMGPEVEELFKEVRMMLHYETDFRREADQTEAFYEKLSDDPRYVVPKVYRHYSGKRVLCTRFEAGVPVDSPEVAALSQERRNKLGAAVLSLLFTETYVHRLVQTDPHFGNYKIRIDHSGAEQDQLILYDFGAVRKYPKRYISPYRDMILGALDHDRERATQAAIDMGYMREDDDQRVKDLFWEMSMLAIEPFDKTYETPSLDGSKWEEAAFDWGQTDLISRMSVVGKSAAWALRLRPPPRESVFLDRKSVGTYMFLKKLGVRFGPRRLLESFLANPLK